MASIPAPPRPTPEIAVAPPPPPPPPPHPIPTPPGPARKRAKSPRPASLARTQIPAAEASGQGEATETAESAVNAAFTPKWQARIDAIKKGHRPELKLERWGRLRQASPSFDLLRGYHERRACPDGNAPRRACRRVQATHTPPLPGTVARIDGRVVDREKFVRAPSGPDDSDGRNGVKAKNEY